MGKQGADTTLTEGQRATGTRLISKGIYIHGRRKRERFEAWGSYGCIIWGWQHWKTRRYQGESEVGQCPRAGAR